MCLDVHGGGADFPLLCRRMFPASQWSAEINAAIASAGFFWLVGESELRSEPVQVSQAPGQGAQGQ